MDVKKYFTERVNKFGGRAVGWGNKPMKEQIKQYREKTDFILPKIKKDLITLDYGCGIGRFANMFDPNKYTGVDIIPELIEQARQRHHQYNFELLDVPLMWESGKKYDMIFIATVLQHNSANHVENILYSLANAWTRKALAVYECTDQKIGSKDYVMIREKAWYRQMIYQNMGVKVKTASHKFKNEEHTLFYYEK